MEISIVNNNKNINELTVIKTARDIDSINDAASKGFWPLIKKVEKSDLIESKYRIDQDRETGHILCDGDYRSGYNSDKYKLVIDWTYYYPHNFKSPYAAYLIPKSLIKGQRVFIEDLIDDFVGGTWNQGNVYRLECCEAIWDGENLCIQYDPNEHCSSIIG